MPRANVSASPTLMRCAWFGCWLLMGCAAPTGPSATGAASHHAMQEVDELVAQATDHWRRRDDQRAVEAAIAAWERAVELDPAARATFAHIAQARHFLGTSILVLGWGSPESAAAAFAQGKRAADQALGLTPTDPGDPHPVALPERADALALYWSARNLYDWAASTDYLNEVLVRSRVQHALARCLDAGANVDHGGPDRLLGALHASPPSFAARDLERARRHFARALAHDPSFLATRVARAESLAVATQARDLFEADLRAVLEADPAASDASAPENRLAQRRAVALLARTDEFFE